MAGGAVAAVDVILTVAGGAFNHNSANASGGGAIMCRDCSEISVYDAVMHSNQAGGDGGAVQAQGSALDRVIFDGVRMSNNK